MEFVKKIVLKLKKLQNINRFFYLFLYKHTDLKSDSILLESHHGEKIDGNVFYIAKELNSPAYSKFTIYLSVSRKQWKKISVTLHHYDLNRIQMVNNKSFRFYKILASAKYLINDTSFSPYFIKKEGQIYLNTWHGTPLKTLGREVSNAKQKLGNIQKNFLASDYLLYPNQYTKNHMVKDYMLSNIFNGKTLLGGYPRNEIFFDDEARNKVRNRLGLASKHVIAYMPTWRDASTPEEIEENSKTLNAILADIDASLGYNQVMYVNLHPMERGSVDFSTFANILPFPEEYETYEFLTASDHLVTDYSSVFFDYAVFSNRITLFAYDYDLYQQVRGMYLSLDDLPFPLVKTVDQLIDQINSPSEVNLKEFIEEFCPYDQATATRNLCRHVLFGEKSLKEDTVKSNGKKNVLIYAGDLSRNGITASLKNVLLELDSSKYNYFVTFVGEAIKTNNFNQIDEILKKNNISYLPTTTFMNGSIFKKLLLKIFERNYITARTFLYLGGKTMFHYDTKRLFMDIKFSSTIMFNGYEDVQILFYSQFKDSHSVIFVHNNMLEEIKLKKNQRRNVLKYAYQNYDIVAAVTEDMVESITTIAEGQANIKIVQNLIPYEIILEKAKSDIEFNEHTLSNKSLLDIHTILNDSSRYKILTIGRFSPEKAHFRLIDAFDSAWKGGAEHAVLIIIGGYGSLYEDTVTYAETKVSHESIIVIKSLDNPYPFLRLSSGFILPSLHEGFGIVTAEADALGKPVVTTNIPGPRTFMQENNGLMVEDSLSGVVSGIEQLISGSVPAMNVDYAKYNKKVVSQFEAIVK